MGQLISSLQKAYFAGFLDGDGSIYVQIKPNTSYRYGFQIAPYIVLYQSRKGQDKFEKLCDILDLGYLRKRNDGICEYIIGRIDEIKIFLAMIEPYVILKTEQIKLMKEILDLKQKIKSKNDFRRLMKLVDRFREFNYSKKRKVRVITP